jgi:hypothetical protein
MAAKARQAPPADRTSGTGKGARQAQSKKVQELIDAGILTPEFLLPSVLQAIEKLSHEDIQALKRVNSKVSLSAFFKARAPQQGG